MTNNPDSKVHEANMGPIWGRQDPGGPHVGPTNFAIWELLENSTFLFVILDLGVLYSGHMVARVLGCTYYLLIVDVFFQRSSKTLSKNGEFKHLRCETIFC